MTVKILLSELGQVTPEQFAKAVRIHAENLQTHNAHTEAVVSGAPEHVAYPPPSAPGIVDQCVRRPDMAIDYEIIDDTPPPPTEEERVRQLRTECRTRLLVAEQLAVAAVLPPVGKIRAYTIRETDLRALPKGTKLSREDSLFLAQQEDRTRKVDAIQRHGAAQEAIIEDLNEEELKTWQPAPFPG